MSSRARRGATPSARRPCSLALAAPALSCGSGFPDEGTLPDSRTERQAYDLLADGFGPGVNGPLVIAVDTSADPTVRRAAGCGDRRRPGHRLASAAAEVNADGAVATLVAIPHHVTAGRGHRSDHRPPPRRRVPARRSTAAPATAHVGGQTADLRRSRRPGRRPASRGSSPPWSLLSFLLLMVVFRSVLVPLKAALMNLLSIGAAYGVLVMVFQWGWGKDLIGLEETVPIIAFIPMFMFAILFGLSMDYEVFLLSRIREEYRATGDNDASVVARHRAAPPG